MSAAEAAWYPQPATRSETPVSSRPIHRRVQGEDSDVVEQRVVVEGGVLRQLADGALERAAVTVFKGLVEHVRADAHLDLRCTLAVCAVSGGEYVGGRDEDAAAHGGAGDLQRDEELVLAPIVDCNPADDALADHLRRRQ
eukprot:2026196-Pleurochrysis_carterae.AAC.1